MILGNAVSGNSWWKVAPPSIPSSLPLLTADLADEIHLAVAPFFVGDADTPRFVLPGGFPHGNTRRMHLAELRQIGDIAFLRYLPKKPTAAAN